MKWHSHVLSVSVTKIPINKNHKLKVNVFNLKGQTLYDIHPDSSVGKESACNTGGPGSIPGAGQSAAEGIGYPLQCSWASLVAQLVKNPPAVS